MPAYLITYDLDQPGQNYPAIIKALEAAGGVRILFSTWLIDTTENNSQVLDRYERHLDANDRIFVTAVTGWGYRNIMNEAAAKKILPP